MEELVKVNGDLVEEITEYDAKILELFSFAGLPTSNVLVKLPERKMVFKNIEDTLSLVEPNILKESYYLSKFLSAVSAGLFDAALNYLWDETVKQLRIRISQYDIEYFYDLISIPEDRRKKLKSAEDLSKITDDELIKGAAEIGLISDVGCRMLDDIKYMRNWASAAHPNQIEITGLQLLAWLETCIKEVISLPLSNIVIQIGALLKNIKTKSLQSNDIVSISTVFENLTIEKAQSLCSGFFGIYCRQETEDYTRENIRQLLPKLWLRVNEDTKYEFGLKYGQMKVNGDSENATLARSFLQIVNAESYLPQALTDAEIKVELDNLNRAHNSMNNFYMEPQFIKQVYRLIGTNNISQNIEHTLTMTVIDAFLTNGNGVCWEANDIYLKVMEKFNDRQMVIGILSFTYDRISSKLRYKLCQRKYIEYLDLVKNKTTLPSLIEIVEDIKKTDLTKLDGNNKEFIARLNHLSGILEK